MSVNSRDIFNDSKGLLSYWKWKPVFLVGICEKKIVIILQSRSDEGEYGVNLIFPCYLSCGKIIFVNYSWSSLFFQGQLGSVRQSGTVFLNFHLSLFTFQIL